MDIATLIEKYGWQGGLLLVFIGFCWWLVKKFSKILDEQTTERQEMTEKYTNFMENHIQHSMEAQQALTQTIKDLNAQTSNDHRLMLEKLGNK